MLRVIFVGSRNSFDDVLVDWLAKKSNLVGIVWTQSTAWQQSWSGRLKFAKRRLRRRGLLKTIDETLFYFFYHKVLKGGDINSLNQQVVERYWADHEQQKLETKSIFATNVNAPEVLEFVETCKPDLVMAMCVNSFFGKKLRAIPQHGVFLWHEGITPEYKGLYSPFWAVHNLDFDRIGYSVLRMSDQIDAGDVYAQGPALDVDPYQHNHAFIGHKSIFDSLPDVERLLSQLETGEAKPIVRADAVPNYYSYPGITDYIRQRIRLRRTRRSRANGTALIAGQAVLPRQNHSGESGAN
jgi:hypothetical protein